MSARSGLVGKNSASFFRPFEATYYMDQKSVTIMDGFAYRPIVGNARNQSRGLGSDKKRDALFRKKLLAPPMNNNMKNFMFGQLVRTMKTKLDRNLDLTFPF